MTHPAWALTLGLLAVAASSSATRAERAWTLRYDRPAERWVEALPVGNGRVGAMVFGGVGHERLQLNEQNVWTGGPRSYARPGAARSLAEIRRLLFAGEQKAAEELAMREFMSQPVRQQFYQPAVDLLLDTSPPTPPPQESGSLGSYERRLDLTHAEAVCEFDSGGARTTRTVFASHPDRVVVVRIEHDAPRALSFQACLKSPHQRARIGPLAERGVLLSGLVNDAEIAPGIFAEGEVRFAAGVVVAETDGNVSRHGDSIEVHNASYATLLVAVDTNVVDYQDISGNADQRVSATLEEARRRGYAQLRERHTKDHADLFGRVRLELGEPPEGAPTEPTDARLLRSKDRPDSDFTALVFHYGRYLLIASSRPGGQPANLQGLWNEDLEPAWGSKYTTNINTEMNYWLAEPCGLSECNLPLFDAIAEVAVAGRDVAREHYAARGWVLHHNFDRWRGAAPINGADHGIWPTGGAWLCQHLWRGYLYSGDETFLSERAYPIMRGAAEFFCDTLVEDPRDERRLLICGPSNSPEHGGLVMGPAMDHQIIRDLFRNTIAAAEILGVDHEFRGALSAKRTRIAPNRVGRLGQLQEWLEDVDDPSDEHRHVSHLWGVHPGDEITPDSPELFAAARRSLAMRGDGGTGWSRAWKVNLWARLLDGDRAHRVLGGLLTLTDSPRTEYRGGGLYPNLFDAHPPFQIDGNFGATAGVCEMLLQSHRWSEPHGPRIELLPALPSAWPDGDFAGLRAAGGFVIDASWRAGQLRRARIQSNVGKTALLCYGDRQREIRLMRGEETVLGGDLQPLSLASDK